MREVIKAKIKDPHTLEVVWSERLGDTTNEHTSVYRYPLHNDLLECFKRLNVHLAFLCELDDPIVAEAYSFDTGEIFKHMEFHKLSVTGITLGGDEEHKGVTIIGKKELKNNRVLNLVAPFTKFSEQDGQDNYRFLDELYSQVEECLNEVEEYIKGKHGPEVQLSLDFGQSTEKIAS